jgi:hypothetical protein
MELVRETGTDSRTAVGPEATRPAGTCPLGSGDFLESPKAPYEEHARAIGICQSVIKTPTV